MSEQARILPMMLGLWKQFKKKKFSIDLFTDDLIFLLDSLQVNELLSVACPWVATLP